MDLVREGEVLPSVASVTELTSNNNTDLILPANFTPVPIHLQLNTTATQKVGASTDTPKNKLLFQIYYLFNVWSLDNDTAPPACPSTREGHLSPGEDFGTFVCVHVCVCVSDGECVLCSERGPFELC